MKYLTVTIPLSIALFGCNEEESKTVQYFKEHPKEHEEMLIRCETIDGADMDANCINARTAFRSLNRQNQRDAARKYYGSGE